MTDTKLETVDWWTYVATELGIDRPLAKSLGFGFVYGSNAPNTKEELLERMRGAINVMRIIQKDN